MGQFFLFTTSWGFRLGRGRIRLPSSLHCRERACRTGDWRGDRDPYRYRQCSAQAPSSIRRSHRTGFWHRAGPGGRALFLLWFGVVPFTQVLLVTLYSAVMMILFSQRAAQNINPVYERWAMTFGAGSVFRIRHILIPGIVPEIIGGLRITLASAWGLEVFAEILGAPGGLGRPSRH